LFLYSRSAAAVLMLGTLVLAARLYGTVGFGYVSAILLVCETAIALGSLGLADAVFYFVGRHPERSAAIVRQASGLLLVTSLPVTAVVVAIGVAMSDETLRLGPALPWLALVVLLELPTQPAVNQLLASGHARLASVLFAGFAALRTSAVLIPAVTGWSLHVVPVAMAAFALVRLAAHLLILRRVFAMPSADRWIVWSELRAMLTFALPVGIAAMVGTLNPQVDKYVVKLMLGLDDFALYSAASWELPLISLIPYAVGAVMQVRYVSLFADGRREELRDVWIATTRKTTLAVVPLAILTIVLAEDIIVLVFGARYRLATTPFRIFTVALLQRVAVYGPMLQAIGRRRVLLVSSGVILATNLVLTVPFTWLIGANGAATATVVANLPAWLMSLHFIGSAWGRGMRDALPWRFYATVTSVAAAAGLVVWSTLDVVAPSPGLRIAYGTGAFAVLYVLGGRLLRVLDANDLRYVRRWLTFGLR
jgi:O-antigen/teichoic acid export membrane protein